MEQVLRDQHSFQEFMVQVLYYQKLIDEIRYMPSKVNALKKKILKPRSHNLLCNISCFLPVILIYILLK